jgi:hypothetical protein
MARTDIFLRECKQTDMEQVIVILQSISEFKPLKKDYPSIWNNFCNHWGSNLSNINEHDRFKYAWQLIVS